MISSYGDGWEFEIRYIKSVIMNPDEKYRVTDGAGFGIIENLGGAWAIDDMLELRESDFLKFKKTYLADYADDLDEYFGVDLATMDYRECDLEEINDRLPSDMNIFWKMFERDADNPTLILY